MCRLKNIKQTREQAVSANESPMMQSRIQNLMLIFILMNVMMVSNVSAKILLSDEESSLIENIMFDMKIINMIKQAGYRIEPLTGISHSGNKIRVNGLSFVVNEDQSSMFMQKYRKKIQAMGYQLFRQERGYDYSWDRLAIIKSSNKYDILNIRKTHAYTHNLSTAKIIEKLKQWDKRYGITIVGAGYNWLNLKFDRLPEGLPAFADEVLAFCPDVLLYSAATVMQLQLEIKSTKALFLQWN